MTVNLTVLLLEGESPVMKSTTRYGQRMKETRGRRVGRFGTGAGGAGSDILPYILLHGWPQETSL